MQSSSCRIICMMIAAGAPAKDEPHTSCLCFVWAVFLFQMTYKSESSDEMSTFHDRHVSCTQWNGGSIQQNISLSFLLSHSGNLRKKSPSVNQSFAKSYVGNEWEVLRVVTKFLWANFRTALIQIQRIVPKKKNGAGKLDIAKLTYHY